MQLREPLDQIVRVDTLREAVQRDPDRLHAIIRRGTLGRHTPKLAKPVTRRRRTKHPVPGNIARVASTVVVGIGMVAICLLGALRAARRRGTLRSDASYAVVVSVAAALIGAVS